MQERSPPPEIEARFNALLEKYGDFLRQSIARICPKDLGLQFDDIEQEARLRIWRVLESEREIAHFGSYIYRIAVSATVNAIQRVKARREEQLGPAEDEDSEEEKKDSLTADPENSPDALAERKELIRKVERALDQLPESRRLAVGLHLRGMTTEEVADLMGWSEPKARNLVYRGLKDLREQLRAAGIE